MQAEVANVSLVHIAWVITLDILILGRRRGQKLAVENQTLLIRFFVLA